MSYDKAPDRNRRIAREWAQSEDLARGKFLRALDNSDVEVTDFEARFLESFLSANQLNWWTENRRATCDQMRKQYGGRV